MKKLPYHYGLKVRCYPSSQQKAIIKRNSDASRFVYNELVAISRELYELKRIKLPIDTVQQRIHQLEQRKKSTKNISDEHLFLCHKDIDSLSLANAKQNYAKAWKAFRKVHRSGVPVFHKKNYTWKYQTNAQYSSKASRPSLLNGTVKFLGRNHAKLPKLGVIRTSAIRSKIWKMREVVRIGTVTVTKDSADCFYLSFQLGSTQPFIGAVTFNNEKLGVDLNTENFLTDSNGAIVANPRYYRKVLKQLNQQKRKLSRRQLRAKKEHRPLREAKNYQKQRLLVAKMQVKVAHQRLNFLHNLTTELVKNHDFLVAEELRSKNLLKNHALALSISDAGWRLFLQQLQNKAELYGKTFVAVDPRNTTQTCSKCGYLLSGSNKLTLKDRTWQCPQCHTKHQRDHNAAKNILVKGIDQLA
ncbi:RNA-guided endonuclease InsQ/TnpB family protein [Ligilactobacillus salitolerans]|nr:RNA-guided endonuclease TnpB family protein [Ligilactobacillus salitolerans]